MRDERRWFRSTCIAAAFLLLAALAQAAAPPLLVTVADDNTLTVKVVAAPAPIHRFDAVTTAADGKTFAVRLLVVEGNRIVPYAYTIAVTGGGPAPNPQPQPEPQPQPQPQPEPQPTPTQIFALVVEETADRAKLPASQVQALTGTGMKAYMDGKGYLFRSVDKDVVDPSGKPPAEIASFLEAAKGKPLPNVVIADKGGTVLYNGPLPATEAACVELLKKHGGP